MRVLVRVVVGTLALPLAALALSPVLAQQAKEAAGKPLAKALWTSAWLGSPGLVGQLPSSAACLRDHRRILSDARATYLRDRKVGVLWHIRPLSPNEVVHRTRRACYARGQIGGQAVPAYRRRRGRRAPHRNLRRNAPRPDTATGMRSPRTSDLYPTCPSNIGDTLNPMRASTRKRGTGADRHRPAD